MNLLELKCQGRRAIIGHYKIMLPETMPPRDFIVLGVRPEDIHLTDSEDPYGICGIVYLQERLGKEKLISVRVQGSDLTIRALVNAEPDWEGQTLYLRLSETDLHCFNWNGNRQMALVERTRLVHNF